MLDLYHATRDELIQLLHERDQQVTSQATEIAQLRTLVVRLTERIGALERQAQAAQRFPR